MKILLLDMDGVLVNFVPHWLNYLNLFEGIDIKPSEVTKYTLNETPAGKREIGKVAGRDVKNFISPFKTPGFFRTAPMMPGAREFIRSLQSLERNCAFEFYVLTSPSDGTSAKEKIEWLDGTFGPVKTIVTKHKHLVRGDYLVDDYPQNVREWLRYNPGGFGMMPISTYLDNELKVSSMGYNAPNYGTYYDPTVINNEVVTDSLFFNQVLDHVMGDLYKA